MLCTDSEWRAKEEPRKKNRRRRIDEKINNVCAFVCVCTHACVCFSVRSFHIPDHIWSFVSLCETSDAGVVMYGSQQAADHSKGQSNSLSANQRSIWRQIFSASKTCRLPIAKFTLLAVGTEHMMHGYRLCTVWIAIHCSGCTLLLTQNQPWNKDPSSDNSHPNFNSAEIKIYIRTQNLLLSIITVTNTPLTNDHLVDSKMNFSKGQGHHFPSCPFRVKPWRLFLLREHTAGTERSPLTPLEVIFPAHRGWTGPSGASEINKLH